MSLAQLSPSLFEIIFIFETVHFVEVVLISDIAFIFSLPASFKVIRHEINFFFSAHFNFLGLYGAVTDVLGELY